MFLFLIKAQFVFFFLFFFSAETRQSVPLAGPQPSLASLAGQRPGARCEGNTLCGPRHISLHCDQHNLNREYRFPRFKTFLIRF